MTMKTAEKKQSSILQRLNSKNIVSTLTARRDENSGWKKSALT